MALTITNVQNYFDTDNQNPYETSGSLVPTTGDNGGATYTLTAGRHYFVLVVNHGSGGGALPTAVSFDPDGTPVSFALVTDGTTEASSTAIDTDTLKGCSLWHAHVSSTTATSFFRLSYAATQSCCAVVVFYLEGETDSGLFVQVVKANGTSTSPACTMAAFNNADNGLLLCVLRVGGIGTDQITATESRTELSETLDTERAHPAVHYQLPNGGDTSVGASFGTSAAWQVFGIEIKGSAAEAKDFGVVVEAPIRTTAHSEGGIF